MKSAGFFANVLLVLVATSCGDAETLLPAEAPTGSATLHFALATSARESPELVDPLTGTVHGQVLLVEEVNIFGNIPGSVPIVEVKLDGVDLIATETASPTWAHALPPGTYVFLGFLDVDANAKTTPALADEGDPVTTPPMALERQFVIHPDESTEQTIVFDQTLWCDVHLTPEGQHICK
jgi:hypothetical protein